MLSYCLETARRESLYTPILWDNGRGNDNPDWIDLQMSFKAINSGINRHSARVAVCLLLRNATKPFTCKFMFCSKFLQVCDCLPGVSTAAVERTFSAVKILETNLRFWQTDENVQGLAMTHLQRHYNWHWWNNQPLCAEKSACIASIWCRSMPCVLACYWIWLLVYPSVTVDTWRHAATFRVVLGISL